MSRIINRRKFIVSAGAVSAAYPFIRSEDASASAPEVIPAEVVVEPEPLHSLPVNQYGHFIEHLGKCIKGGIWAEGESEDMFLGGVRPELIQAMKSINPPLIRYPGGCFADGYHWRDGIGPRSERPRQRNMAWAKLGPLVGPEEDNHFGTDEFCMLCEEVGAAPMITVNVGSGTAEEAAAWVEYCNGSEQTRWGSERKKNGRARPYDVKYWFVGNEIFGWHEIGHQTPPQYVKTFREYHAAMKKVDPDIKLIAVGAISDSGERPNRIVLEQAGDIIDYLSIHQYVPVGSLYATMMFQVAHMKGVKSRKIYYNVMGSLAHMEKFLKANISDVESYSPAGKKVPIAFDEWNLWFSFYDDLIRANYNLRDGLWVASMLNLLHRHAPHVQIANIAQMVNCLGIINSTKKGTFLTPSALAFKVYTEHAKESLVPSAVKCSPIPHETGIPALDVSATMGGNGMSVFMVNRHYNAEIQAECVFKGLKAGPEAEVAEMRHPNPVKYNTFNDPNAVSLIKEKRTLAVSKQGSGTRVAIRLKPHSLTCVDMKVRTT